MIIPTVYVDKENEAQAGLSNLQKATKLVWVK